MTDGTGGLSPEQADCFARGLYFLANVDGMEDREQSLIQEFLADSPSTLRWEDLASGSFSPLEATQVLETSWLKRVFLKVAVALVQADGRFSDAERHAIGEIADAFGLSNAEFGDIEQEALRVDLEA